jgi:mannose-1-phosphate guanylyltransferase
MLQETFDRCLPWIPAERFHVVTNEAQSAESLRQLPGLPPGNVLVEPCGRNTAPCIGLAAIHLLHADPEAVMLVMPADHVIRPIETFRAAADQAAAFVAASPGSLVLFGVPPTYPATGFGYIERGEPQAGSGAGAFRVQAFREKPNKELAQQFLDAGRYYWNCGIFVWRARQILEALREFEPEIHARLIRMAEDLESDRWRGTLATEFPRMKSISIDHAVLERARNVTVLPAPFEWDDVGSWQALTRLLGVDEQGNTIDGPHCGVDTRDCIIRSDSGHLVATIGLENCIVVHTPEATLVARKDDENALRQLVALIQERGYERFL